MSTSFAYGNSLSRIRRSILPRGPQSNSWLGWLDRWLARSERMRQQDALRDLADDPHLLDDLGITREEALKIANRPFWP